MTRYDDLMSLEFPEVVQDFTEKDIILYNLGIGAGGTDDPQDLAMVYEHGLAVVPSVAVTLAYPGFWYRNLPTGLDHARVLHAAERFVIHAPLPPRGRVRARPRITAIHDKGAGRGALVVSERVIRDDATGTALATVTQTAFCRGDGGLGGPVTAPPPPHALPDRPPDRVLAMPVSPRAAQIYRLSGDDNPLHIDPQAARQGGFDAPILHGLATYGHVARAILAGFGAEAPLLSGMDCRFTGIVLPGDRLDVALWRDGGTVSFRAAVSGRTVIDNGAARLSPPLPLDQGPQT